MSGKNGFYIPSLDGFRAIAATLVFVSHAGYQGIIPGGFGVSIFFFLSGYLITTLLRLEYEKYGLISLSNFYMRRVFRILPPMYFVLLCILLLCSLGVLKSAPSIAGITAEIFQFTNYYVIFFGLHDTPPFTEVFWSLAVEEHFYLIFPISVIFCLQRFNYSYICKIFLIACMVVLGWRLFLVYSMHVPAQRTNWGTDTRLDGLLFGCVMGLWSNPVIDSAPRVFKSSIGRVILTFSALFALGFSLIYRDSGFRETFRYSLQSIAFFPIFYLAITYHRSLFFRPLNWGWVRGLGVISYSFYLTHVFWIFVAQHVVPSSKSLAAVLAFIVTTIFSAGMYYYIEKPCARLRERLRTHQDRRLVAADEATQV